MLDGMRSPRFANNVGIGIDGRSQCRISDTMRVVVLVFFIQCNAVSAHASANASAAAAAFNFESSALTRTGGHHRQALRGVQRQPLRAVPSVARSMRWLLDLGQLQTVVSTGSAMGNGNLPTPPPPGALPPVPKKLLIGDLRSGGLAILPPMTGPPPPPGPDPPVPPLPVPTMHEVGANRLVELPVPKAEAGKNQEYDFFGNVVAVKNFTMSKKKRLERMGRHKRLETAETSQRGAGKLEQ